MTLRKSLLVCGVLASVVYVAIDVLAEIRYSAYHNFTSQAISELMARGAPTERFVDPLFLLHGVLVIAFGVGVWMSAGEKRLLRATGGLLVAIGAVGLPGPLFFEMGMRGTGDTQADILHIALTAVLVLLILLAIGVSAFAQGQRFRIYALATVLLLVVSGALTAFQSRHLGEGATPWLGITERINIGGYLLWQAVLAIALLRAHRTGRPTHRLDPVWRPSRRYPKAA